MREIQVELLASEINAPVLKFPGRAYPGVLIQGDSLRNLYALADELAGLVTAGEASEVAGELKDLLRAYLYVYEEALQSQGLPLPYPGSLTAAQDTDPGQT